MSRCTSSCQTMAVSVSRCLMQSYALRWQFGSMESPGGSGASRAAADVLAAMLNAGVYPIVPEISSVGAADIQTMAAIAEVAVGQGRAAYQGELLPGAEALRRAGITPLVLSGKDGLALISANGVSVGHAALVVARSERTAEAADIAAALSMEATVANPSIIHPAVGRAKPIPGQVAVAEHIHQLLTGSRLMQPGVALSVQDALSFRVVPQVHGALREYISAARNAVTVELNAADDNPLASVPDQTLISNGNFHPIVLAIATDALRIALVHVGQLSERRMAHLWDAYFRQMARPPTAAYGLRLRYPAAALFPELEAALRTRNPGHTAAGPRRRRSQYRCAAERTEDRRGAGTARGPARDRADARA